LEATKKTKMVVETQRLVFEKIESLSTAVYDLMMENHKLQGQLEESRRSAEICVSAAAAQFGTELRLRETAHEQTLEAVVTRFAEKEALRTYQQEAAAPVVETQQPVQGAPEAETFAQVARAAPRRARGSNAAQDGVAARSRSRVVRRKKLLAEGREQEHRPAFVVQPTEATNATEVSNEIWRKVMSKKVMSRCQTIKTKQGKVVIRPLNKETADVLKAIGKDSGLLQEESLLWPRILVRGVPTSVQAENIQDRTPNAAEPRIGHRTR